MENNILDMLPDGQSLLTTEGEQFLMQTTSWARFLAIVGFVMTGLMVIFALAAPAIFSSIMSSSEGLAMPSAFGGTIVAVYLILAIIMFFPYLFLFKFANRTKSALQTRDAEGLTSGLGNLKATFQYVGIVTIVVLGLYAIVFLLAIVGGQLF